MSGLYFVYMKFARENNTLRADYGRHLLHFESRYAADELFRALQDVRNSAGANIWTLSRLSPQFWCYDTLNDGDPWWSIVEFQRRNTVPEFNYKFGSTALADAATGRDWPIIPNPAIGTDWVHGNAFFIRNRREPHLYWFVQNDIILVSNRRRSKFRIQGVDFDETDLGKKVLIRKDKVTISVVPETAIQSNVQQGHFVARGEDNALKVGNMMLEWSFGDLFNASIGVTWVTEVAQDEVTARYMTDDGGDEWELC